MKKMPVVLDLETKYRFDEVDDKRKLGVSVVGLYDYQTQVSKAYEEPEFPALFKILEHCSYIIGFNNDGFDIPVLAPYYPGDLSRFPSLDLLSEIKRKIGRRLSLNDVARVTLGKQKSGHGLQAIDFWREGKMEELKRYCLDDVMLTKELFEYGAEHGEIFYLNEVGKIAIHVDWKKYLDAAPAAHDTHLPLPF